ncbi:hypothetical protein ACFOEK_07480 [Litoribrevibacter euphylliae]|uniref:Lipoprotein n=1 Tax=Litoribrevibacter euphylliae TaxID=1834034 RepID=A0ABV7HDS6_9GAMM
MYKIKYAPIKFVMIAMIAGCSTCVSAQSNAPLEPLHAIFLERDNQSLAVHFKAISHGCTTTQDFELTIKESNEINQLSITRLRPDRCRKMPKLVSLTKRLRYDEINASLPIQLKNHLFIK